MTEYEINIDSPADAFASVRQTETAVVKVPRWGVGLVCAACALAFSHYVGGFVSFVFMYLV